MREIIVTTGYDQLSEAEYRIFFEMMPEKRQKTVGRLRRAEDRKAAVVSWMQLMLLLAKKHIKLPWLFNWNPYGKPFLLNYPGTHFSISHSKSGCMCAISDRTIGVDIQDIVPYNQEIANRVCSAKELLHLSKSTDPDMYFTRIWAMKESYVKMLGIGIGQIPLSKVDTTRLEDKIEVTMYRNMVIAVAYCDRLEEEERCLN